NDGHRVAALLRTRGQHLTEGFSAPVAVRAISLRELGRPDLLQRHHDGSFSLQLLCETGVCSPAADSREAQDAVLERPSSATPGARRIACGWAEVSSASSVGTEPSTMPAPAETRACRPLISAQRSDTYHSPSPERSVHPTA